MNAPIAAPTAVGFGLLVTVPATLAFFTSVPCLGTGSSRVSLSEEIAGSGLWEGLGAGRCLQSTCGPLTRLFVGNKIFGVEEEPDEKALDPNASKDPGETYGASGEDDQAKDGNGGKGLKKKSDRGPIKRKRKKQGWTTDALGAEVMKDRKLAEELKKKYPDIGVVEVDRMGNVVGGVNPFEDTEVEDEHPLGQGNDEEEFPEIGGVIAGMDDPADAPWRVQAQNIIREEVEGCGLKCYDILWTFHKVEVTVSRGDVDDDDVEAGYVDSEQLMTAIKAVNAALEAQEDELFVLGRHELIIATPGAKDILTTDREFKAFKGFDIIVTTGGPFPNKRKVEGKLLERTFDELIITQSGRKVSIPLALVDEVRLPQAVREPGDYEIL